MESNSPQFNQAPDFSEALAHELGRIFGAATGHILAMLFFAIFIYLVWGLPWQRILTKAGFRGKGRSVLLMLIVAPAFLTPAILSFSESLARVVLGVGMVSTWLGLILLAIVPFPKNKN